MEPQADPKLRALPTQLIETGDGLILKRGCVEVKVTGEQESEVVRLVFASLADEDLTQSQLCESFAETYRPIVADLVQQLLVRRILIYADGSPLPGERSESPLEIFCWHFGTTAEQMTSGLNQRQIAILGTNRISQQLGLALAASGMQNFEIVDYPLLRNLALVDDQGRVTADRWPSPLRLPSNYREWAETVRERDIDCLVATSDFGGQHLMREWNQFSFERKVHFLPVVLQDFIGYVGPLVVPGETACYECVRARQNANMRDPQNMRAAEYVASEGQHAVGYHPSMASVLGDFAAIELTKFYSGVLPLWRVGTMIEINLIIPRVDARKVLKIPRCPVCSPFNTTSPTSLKRSTVDGFA
jgi:bacteriocin biosynthesis cyclodehydratase domain-containing protein